MRLFLVLSLLIHGCHLLADEQSHTQTQKNQFVQTMNEIIELVTQPITEEELAKTHQIVGSTSLDGAEIILLGETHTDFSGLSKSFRVLETYFEEGDIILLEGANHNQTIAYANYLIIHLWAVLTRSQLGIPYTPDCHEKIVLGQWKLITDCASRVNWSQLKVPANYMLGHWDDLNGSLHDAERRNLAMVQALQHVKANVSPKHIFVFAGSFHLPHGDYRRILPVVESFNQLCTNCGSKWLFNLDSVQTPIAEFYSSDTWVFYLIRLIEYFTKSHAKLKSSRPIFEYLKDKNWIEVLPREAFPLPTHEIKAMVP